MNIFNTTYEWYYLLISFILGGYLYRSVYRLLFRVINVLWIVLGSAVHSFFENNGNGAAIATNENDIEQKKSPVIDAEKSIRKAQPIFDKLNYLENRLNTLKTKISSGKNLDECKREMEKCKALSENIKDLATFQRVNFQEIFYDFQKIRELLVDMEFLIGKRENTWWRRIIQTIKAIFQVIAIKLLPPGL